MAFGALIFLAAGLQLVVAPEVSLAAESAAPGSMPAAAAAEAESATNEKAKKEVETFIKETVADISQIVNNTETADAIKIAALSQLLSEIVDTEWMAKFTIGHLWRNLSSAQQQEFIVSYKRHMIQIYVPHLLKYRGHEVSISNVKILPQDQYLVNTKISSNASKGAEGDLALAYRCKDYGDGQIKIRDIIGEGISLISTQRSEFGTVLRQKGIEELLRSLSSKEKTG